MRGNKASEMIYPASAQDPGSPSRATETARRPGSRVRRELAGLIRQAQILGVCEEEFVGQARQLFEEGRRQHAG